MNATIWSGATNAADIFFLIAAIVAGLAAVLAVVRQVPDSALVPAAVALVALGLLAI